MKILTKEWATILHEVEQSILKNESNNETEKKLAWLEKRAKKLQKHLAKVEKALGYEEDFDDFMEGKIVSASIFDRAIVLEIENAGILLVENAKILTMEEDVERLSGNATLRAVELYPARRGEAELHLLVEKEAGAYFYLTFTGICSVKKSLSNFP